MRWTDRKRALQKARRDDTPVSGALLPEDDVRRIPLAAMFTALGVLFPQLFHMMGLGATFLPMFLPVLTAAMLLRMRLALTVAALTPVLSWLLTGMPPLSPPVLPLLIAELTVSAAVISHLRLQRGWRVLPALAVGLLVDRALLYIIIETVTALAGIRHPMFGPAAVLVGLPGIALQLIVIPPAVTLIVRRFPRFIPSSVAERG